MNHWTGREKADYPDELADAINADDDPEEFRQPLKYDTQPLSELRSIRRDSLLGQADYAQRLLYSFADPEDEDAALDDERAKLRGYE